MPSWQQQTFAELRTREWRSVGPLFEAVEQQIPLHIAMRWAMHPGRYGFREMPVNGEARWLYFTRQLAAIGVELEGEIPGRRRRIQWNTRIRLKYLADRQCPDCAGPVVKASYSSAQNAICLRCSAPRRGEIHHVVTLPPPITFPTRAPPPVQMIELATPVKLSPAQKLKGAIVVQTGNTRTLAYRRTLARELKPILNLSLNRLEGELQRHNDNLEAVLALHGKTTRNLPTFFATKLAIRATWEHLRRKPLAWANP